MTKVIFVLFCFVFGSQYVNLYLHIKEYLFFFCMPEQICAGAVQRPLLADV